MLAKMAKSLDDKLSKQFVKVNRGPGNKNMILSQDICLSMDTRKTLRNNNILIVGGSGSGKTRFEVKPNLLQANCSYVITDPSGEILQTQGNFLRSQGYEIKVFNLNQMQYSNCYNPFAYIRDDQGVLTMINALIKNTTAKGSTSSDPFWEKSEQALLQAICFYLYKECCPEDRNFANVMKLLRCADVKEDQEGYESTLDIMFQQVEQRDPEHIAVRFYKIFKQAAGKTAKSILITCSTRLQVFNMQKIAKLTNVDTLDMKTIGDKKTALFCITPVGDQSYNFLVALLYTQLFQTLYFHAETECPGLRLPVHVRFMLDEFANIGTIPDFEEKLATMRKYEISCTIIIQNMAQLKTMYKDSWESITGNCDTFIFLGGQEQATLEYVSKMLGKETIVTQTDSRNFGGRSGGGSRSKQIIGRELMTPTEIGQMDTMECIIQIRGLRPFFGKKYDYPKHPNYHLTGDAKEGLKFDVTKEVNIDDRRGKSSDERRAYQKYRHSKEMNNIKRRNRELEKRRSEMRTHEKSVEEPRELRKKSLRGVRLLEPKPAEETLAEVLNGDDPDEIEKHISFVSAGGVSTEDFEAPIESKDTPIFNKVMNTHPVEDEVSEKGVNGDKQENNNSETSNENKPLVLEKEEEKFIPKETPAFTAEELNADVDDYEKYIADMNDVSDDEFVPNSMEDEFEHEFETMEGFDSFPIFDDETTNN